MDISVKDFGELSGQIVQEYTLTNRYGVSLSAMTYGAAITSIRVPDKNGLIENIVLGYDTLDEYVSYRPYYGATVGRVAGRIDKGKFTLEGKNYQLETNDKTNHSHGGNYGLDTKIWTVKTESTENEGHLIFTYKSLHGENGYPGNLSVQVTYTLTESSEWKISYQATTDKTTLFNPTNHVYFNLSGDPTKAINQHVLALTSEYFAELKEDYIPTGILLPVKETPFDFMTADAVNKGFESTHPQNQLVSGYDHPFVLEHIDEKPEAVLSDTISGRRVQMTTDRDAVVIFAVNTLDGRHDNEGNAEESYAGIALEAQNLPNAINQKGFGKVILHPNETFHSETTYRFDTML
ncbi:MAG: aldose epimerase family protein [Carnobacterium sp.]|uniref:aldose epimerase family protein n=1 Tax=Carnobacterium sp. TaxID=48221 RepID=UPI003314C41C